MSKNNPENRGGTTELRKHNGQEVKPVLYIDPVNKRKYIAGATANNGALVLHPVTKEPLAYKNIH